MHLVRPQLAGVETRQVGRHREWVERLVRRERCRMTASEASWLVVGPACLMLAVLALALLAGSRKS